MRHPPSLAAAANQAAAVGDPPASTRGAPPLASWLRWCDRYRWGLLAAVLLLYLLGFNGQWRIGPDSAEHVVVAQHLAAGQGYTHPTGHQRFINPGLSYLTAATFRWFGPDQFLPIHILMLLMGLGALGLTYTLIRLRFDRPTAVAVTCMLAIAEKFYRYAFQVLTDMPFLIGALLFLVGHELIARRGRGAVASGLALMAAGTAVMALFRSVVLTFLAAVVLALAASIVRGPRRLRSAGVAMVVLLALLAVRAADPRLSAFHQTVDDEARVLRVVSDLGRFAATLAHAAYRTGPKLLTETLAEAVFGLDLSPVLSLPLALVLIGVGLALVRVRLLWGCIAGVFLMQWLMFIATDRYVLVLLPLLALGWWRAMGWADTRLPGRWAPCVVIAMLVLWITPNLIRVGAFIREQRQVPFLASYEEGKYVALEALAQQILQHAGPNDYVIAADAPQLVYFTGLRVLGPDSLNLHRGKARTLKRLAEADRIWLVQPPDGPLRKKLKRLALEPGRIVARVERPRGEPFLLQEVALSPRIKKRIERRFQPARKSARNKADKPATNADAPSKAPRRQRPAPASQPAQPGSDAS
ncbi:MAG TPA: glycosyltransferase family 39 protein [Phycisphaeraceae bacterium]